MPIIRDADFGREWGQMKVAIGLLDGLREKDGYTLAVYLQRLLRHQLELNELMMKKIEDLENSNELRRRGLRS